MTDQERELANNLIEKQQEMIDLLERENKELRDISESVIALAKTMTPVVVPLPFPMPMPMQCHCRWWL